MHTTLNNDNAFPVAPSDFSVGESGLTKMEHFSCEAMKGLLPVLTAPPKGVDIYDFIANEAVKHAAALINRLNLAADGTKPIE